MKNLRKEMNINIGAEMNLTGCALLGIGIYGDDARNVSDATLFPTTTTAEQQGEEEKEENARGGDAEDDP